MVKDIHVVVGALVMAGGVISIAIGLTGLSVMNQCSYFCEYPPQETFVVYFLLGGGIAGTVAGAIVLAAGVK